jgi:hypothetical protein
MRFLAVAQLFLLPLFVHGFKGLLKGTTPDQCETVLDDVWEEKCETLIKVCSPEAEAARFATPSH